MLADLADFGHDCRPVNLQRSSAYLLVRNGNLFDSRVPVLKLLGRSRLQSLPDCCVVWSGAVCCQQGHQRVAWMAARLCES